MLFFGKNWMDGLYIKDFFLLNRKMCQKKDRRTEINFVFFYIVNEIWHHPELTNTFLVGNH